ncbi:serine/threonine-protein phosphatase 2A regulatory subunit B'' subunit beta-like [Stegodyphus dumicola]|uniref:serine/threonine-protein phosphatase 2A regulatory subunit B'' subunit beta-like n=1 Tax=Stegodyphus dumicola TaxID=202533 RepID=UPI0015B0EE96|nr:serine/threonine-protein phosphatase 2A regulatory subunit B'' subunit beta-like [Stegodyphus dumicola]
MGFQHDGAPAHFSHNVRTHLDDVDGQTSVDGRGGPTHHGGSVKDKESVAPTSPRISSLRRAVKSGKRDNASIPRFYFPDGKPLTQAEIEVHLKKVAAVFAGLNDGKASREEFGIITKACGLPLYWKLPLFLAARGDKKSSVGCEAFLEYWRRVVSTCHDEASKFIYILSRGKRNYLLSDDFFPMMQDVIDSHPGLTFLKEATEFHSRYIHTVIARIYYCVNRSWSGRITAPELRKSNFLQVLATLEEEEDINQITDYFSYEHFYVIYCKFWELDKDHDLYIDQNDLKLHSGGALSARIIQRIFSGAVTRGPKQKEGKMSYTEFVWFLISEEDKRHPRSIEYWFRCMDLDGDGFLSMYELEYFYQEQLQRLEALGIETLPFNDCLCQMLDIIKPKIPGKISLADLKKCKMTPIFFDTFFNLEKYLDHEQRDPFVSQREHDGEGPEISDWDRFAAEEYELLVAEEGANEQQDEFCSCDGECYLEFYSYCTYIYIY